ncbi:hypothetical protein PFLUV_G00209440 [Perca fluviatilis]|uniref:HECT domain-containing protein n=1 Tax=Perca fluviatilis TaxID=8168 RepID=A0A6A5EJV5_PERFL|nr:hypothetical protein PFLUV_G00209440 [Perca fluviatilis]
MGRRTIQVPEGACHKEITYLLCEVYFKMNELEGAWMLHKAMGGSGQRRLTLVSPDEMGYTGAGLFKSWGGKGCLYVMPIQHRLDMSPLPYTAREFEAMPKARCVSCSKHVPLQLLSLHVETCTKPELDEIHSDYNDDVDEGAILQQSNLGSTDSMERPSCSQVPDVKTTCPICQEWISSDIVEIHASICGERVCNETEESQAHPTESISDVIRVLHERVDNTAIFSICVTREDMLERGMKQWQRQKKASPKNPLRVTFLGETGIDNGALRKEFLTEMVTGIQSRFFVGGDNGKTPKYSMTDMDKHHFKTVGEILAVSIAQGGPPPNFFMDWCYNYMSTGELDQEAITEMAVTDPELIDLIQEIRAADNTSLMECTDRILSCGYTGPVSIEKREDILRSIVLYSTVRLLPMLQQICSGMKLYGLLSLVQKEKDICRQLFVLGSFSKVDADFLVKSLSPVFSEKGTMRRQRECRVVNFLQDFIQDMEDEEDGINTVLPESASEDEGDKEVLINVGKFCQWLTGQAHIPLSHADREGFSITIEFDHDCQVRFGTHSICYPIVNACSCSVTFPVAHLTTQEEFRRVIAQAITYGYDFGRS